MSEDDWDKVCILGTMHQYLPCRGHANGYTHQCWSANVKVPRALLLAAKPTFDQNPDGGLMITTGSIAVCLVSCLRCIRFTF